MAFTRDRGAISLVELLTVLVVLSAVAAVVLVTSGSLTGRSVERALEETARSVGREVAAAARVQPDRDLAAVVDAAADGVPYAAADGTEVTFARDDAVLVADYDERGLLTAAFDSEPGYAEQLAADGPLAHWRFEEEAGPVTVDETGAWDAAVEGADLTVAGPSPALGSAVAVDGSSSWVGTGFTPSAAQFADGATVELWVRPDSVSGDRFPVGSWGSPRLYIGIRDGDLQTGFGSDWNRQEGVSVPAGQWSHLALTNDGSTTRAYLDGVEVDSYSSSFAGENSNAMAVGQVAGEGRWFAGVVDEVAVFDEPLAPERLVERAAAGSP